MGSFGYHSFSDRASINRTDTITGGLGADVLTGGSGADDFIQTLIFNAGTGVVNRDTITDFSVADVDQVGNFGVANLANITTLTQVALPTTDVANTNAVAVAIGNIGATFDLGGVAGGTNMLLTTGNFVNSAAVQVALRANAQAGAATTAAEGFLIAYDNGVDTTIAIVDYDAVEADGDLISAATVTDLLTFSGLADNTTLVAGNFLNFVA